MYLKFGIEGVTQLSRTLLGVAANVRDWTPAFEQSGDQLISIFSNEVFETEGGEIDERWAELSPKYAARKAKKYPGEGILTATGTMRNSFDKLVDATSLTIWNGASYFKYHQSSEPRQKIPRRVMMKLTENMKQMVVKNFNEYFQETVNT